jgi:hypothetical protein
MFACSFSSVTGNYGVLKNGQHSTATDALSDLYRKHAV